MKEEELHEEFDLLNMSIDWWKGRANRMMGQIQMLEERFNEDIASEQDYKQYEELMEESRNLIARGELETINLQELEDKAHKFFAKKGNEKSNDSGEAEAS